MAKLFRITPLEKKSVEYFVDVYSEDADGNIRGWSVTETYRWGQGFRELDDTVVTHEADRVRCDPGIGWGCELDDLCAVWFEFDDSFTEQEQAEIRAHWDEPDDEGRYGTGWLYDGAHDWQVEYDCVYVIGPVKIDIVDEDAYNEVIEENISPTTISASNAWPFATGSDSSSS
jgi:hypothetical protein